MDMALISRAILTRFLAMVGGSTNVSKEWPAAEISTIRAKADALEDPDHCPLQSNPEDLKPY